MKLSEEQQIKRDKILKWVALILCLILPVTVAGMLTASNTTIFTDIVIHVTWCGFYGCILLRRQRVHIAIKIFFVIINIAAFTYPAIGLSMTGISGPFVLLLKTVIPYIPWFTLAGWVL